MLVCPQCQFDNPNSHQYCQRCGTSLTYTTCSECGANVSFSDESCPNCGASTSVIWWAIMTKLSQLPPSQGGRTMTQHPDPSEKNALLPIEQYLDPGQRYRLTTIDHLSTERVPYPNKYHSFQGKVIDCQPLQKSVLSVLLEEQNPLASDIEHLEDVRTSSWIPELAFPYLILQEFYPTIPEIHEAWLEDHQEVILLSDRSDWQLLGNLWAKEALPTLQIVYWFDEMAKLWKALSEVNCRQSLLVVNNLRVDEDQTFGLQQLYADPSEQTLTLQELGKIWRELFEQSKDCPADPLMGLIEQIINGEIDNITALRLQLQELADEQQMLLESNLEACHTPPSSNPVIPETLLQDLKTSHIEKIDRPQEHIQTDWGTEVSYSTEGDDLPTAVIPMQLLTFSDAGYTDNGRQRRHNEDCFGITTGLQKQQSNRGQQFQARGLYIVCDGMGGHAAGEVASALAVDTLQRYFATAWQNELPTQEVIEQGILLANQTIYQINQEKESYGSGRMGTTLVMALIYNTRIAIAHVGDSRIYRINRKWGLEQLTIDHEVGQRAIQDGIDAKIAYSRPDAYQLTQALGPHDNPYVKPDIQFFEVHEDTLLLLCSDGLSDNELVETHWKSHLNPFLSSRSELDEELQKLVTLANQKNGHDNITAILVRIKVQPYLEQSIWF